MPQRLGPRALGVGLELYGVCTFKGYKEIQFGAWGVGAEVF